MTLTLKELQQETLRMLTSNFETSFLEQAIISDDKADAAERLRVYQRSYYGGLIGCLKAQFPVTLSLLGELIFVRFARDYLDQYPSKSYTLNDLGQNFSRFFSENRPDKAFSEKELWIDFVIEVIEFEWSINIAFDAIESPLIVINDAWSVNSNLVLFEHRFLTYALCYAVLNGVDAPAIAPEQENYGYIVRKNHELKQVPLGIEEFRSLKALIKQSHMPQNETFIDKFAHLGILILNSASHSK